MRAVWAWWVPLLLCPGSAAAAAQTGNLTGTWHLNVEKSQWGTVKKPHSVVLIIEHRDPALRYHGSVVYASEESRDFAFDGALDGKEYAMTRSYGPGLITLKRLDAFTFESVFTSEDGLYVENTRTTVSMDGRTLTRRYRLRSPEGVKTWTELYERR